MKFATPIIFIAICGALSGCTPKSKTAFYLDRSIFNEDRGVETPDAIIGSQSFWTKYVETRLPNKFSEEHKVRESLELSLGNSHDGKFSEVVLSFKCSNPQHAALLSKVVIQGLSEYIAESNGGKEAIRFQK